MVFVIAEAGVNHNGSMIEAYKLIDAAYNCGANAVKFQAFTPEKLDPPGVRRDMLTQLAFDQDEFQRLRNQCEYVGIEFMATPFDVEWLEFLVFLGIKRIKISSGSIGNTELLESSADTDMPVYLSTGLVNEDELYTALRIIYRKMTLIHCVSEYPTPVSHINLCRMQFLKKFGLPVGLSDHSMSIYPAIAAVGMGATVIEKHLTMDRSAEGPDHSSSLEPDDFSEMVCGVRAAESALGDSELFNVDHALDALSVKKERDEWRMSLS